MTLPDALRDAPDEILLSVVVPAFNEEDNVRSVVVEARACFDIFGLTGRHELILVDDGSTDATGAVIDALAAEFPGIIAEHHPHNRGLGAAERTGFARSRGAYVSFLPADGQIHPGQINRFLAEIGTADLLVSERAPGPDEGQWRAIRPWHRRGLTAANRLLVRALLGFDPRGMRGLFLIRGALLRSLGLRSDTGMVNYEIIAQCRRRGCQIVRSTLECRQRLSGTSKVGNLRTVCASTWELARMRWRG